jgi:hypothetical protein
VAILRRNNDYDIRAATFARSNQENYSFSMPKGILRREPGGTILLALRYVTDNEFEVRDASEKLIAKGVLRSPGCEVLDELGRRILRITRANSGPGQSLYHGVCAGQDVCRYTWSSGSGPLNPLLLLDFDSGEEVDRALAIVVAPFLEEEARLESEKYFRSYG